jgi:hypothetical protein
MRMESAVRSHDEHLVGAPVLLHGISRDVAARG